MAVFLLFLFFLFTFKSLFSHLILFQITLSFVYSDTFNSFDWASSNLLFLNKQYSAIGYCSFALEKERFALYVYRNNYALDVVPLASIRVGSLSLLWRTHDGRGRIESMYVVLSTSERKGGRRTR